MARIKTHKNLKSIITRWKAGRTRLIVLAGKRKSGKDVLISYILKNYPGFRHYRFAEAPDMIARILELPIERRIQHALFGVNALLHPILGESAYKRRVARLVDREKPVKAIIESARTKEEYEEFVVKRKGILIAVDADDRTRYLRALEDSKRSDKKRDEGKMSFHEFVAKEQSVIERDIDWIVRRAHFLLTNENGKKEFHSQADEIMKILGMRK